MYLCRVVGESAPFVECLLRLVLSGHVGQVLFVVLGDLSFASRSVTGVLGVQTSATAHLAMKFH